jgi:hypothetical protein
MNLRHSSGKRLWARSVIVTGAVAVVGAAALSIGLTAAGAAPAKSHSFSFKLVPSPGIKACLPHIGGSVKITPGDLNDTMTVSVKGLPPGTGLDLFVIQLPDKPFGLSWYQTDVQAGRYGTGSATVRGVFDSETFSVDPGTPTVAPTHQYHLGLWFNNPRTPFNLGCEGSVSAPIVTPFNGEQKAGIQALNTANFPDAKGPLSHVHR